MRKKCQESSECWSWTFYGRRRSSWGPSLLHCDSVCFTHCVQGNMYCAMLKFTLVLITHFAEVLGLWVISHFCEWCPAVQVIIINIVSSSLSGCIFHDAFLACIKNILNKGKEQKKRKILGLWFVWYNVELHYIKQIIIPKFSSFFVLFLF